jgi:hypothetical protein
MEYHLVYQCGIANVFRGGKRVLQGAYSGCEYYCMGLLEAGKKVSVWHCDQADINGAEWEKGAGDLWADHKEPPA